MKVTVTLEESGPDAYTKTCSAFALECDVLDTVEYMVKRILPRPLVNDNRHDYYQFDFIEMYRGSKLK